MLGFDVYSEASGRTAVDDMVETGMAQVAVSAALDRTGLPVSMCVLRCSPDNDLRHRFFQYY